MSTVLSAGPTARERSRRRKWIYGAAIIVLIVILFELSMPATLGTKEIPGQPGGVLAQYRESHGLSQTELGQIDPTSQTIRLATLGMRGIASTLLWSKANEYQMKKDWTRLRAALDQISKLQPHSILVWRYQAWNLSYNVSVAFDDYHDKFYWVIQGLNYMLDGIRMNDKEPRLCWDMAWFISNKIGRDDCAKYYRRLFSGDRGFDGKDAPDYVKEFRERRDFGPPGVGFPPSCRPTSDNWKVGKAWFLGAESKINPPRYPVRGMAVVIFYSDAPTTQFYYADAVEKDGVFGQVAQRAWHDAEVEWHDFGERSYDSPYDCKLQLNRREELFDEAEDKKDRLDVLAPGVRDEIEKEKRAGQPPEIRAAWDKYRQELAEYKLKRKKNKGEKLLLQPSAEVDLRERSEARPDEIARRAPQVHRKEALALAKEISFAEERALWTNRERMKVNFDFWRTRAKAEQTADCVAARKAIHDGDTAYAKGDMIRARPKYELGLHLWRKVLDDPEFHSLVEDVSLGGDLVDVIRRYIQCLDQDDEDLPDSFPLWEIIDKHGARQGSPFPPVKRKTPAPSAAKKPVEEKPVEKPSEAKPPEAKTPEAKTSDVKQPEAKKPEAKTSDVKQPEAKKPEAKGTATAAKGK